MTLVSQAPATPSGSVTPAEARTGHKQRLAWWPTIPMTVVTSLVVGVPLLIVLAYSVFDRGLFGIGVTPAFHLDWYRQLFVQKQLDGTTSFDPRYLQVFGTSTWMAALTTVLCALLAVPTAVWMATRPPKVRKLLVLVVTIPFWTNTLIRTYAWMLILNDNGVANKVVQGLGLSSHPVQLLYTPFATGIGLVYVFLPFMILPVYAAAEKLDITLVEAAYDLGARRWTAVRRVLLPALRPGIIAGAALVFMPAMGAFLQPELLGGGKTQMVGNLIQQQFGPSRNWPFGSAIAVALMALILVVLMLIALGTRLLTRRQPEKRAA